MGEDNNCSYSVADNPKFYIRDEYGNMKEFGKFASIDPDLFRCGEGSNFFDEIKPIEPIELIPPEKLTNTIRIIKNDTATFSCNIDNIDLSFIWGNRKSIQIAELKYHLSMEAKNGNLLSNLILEGLNRGLITIEESLYFVSNGWKRMHGFPVTRFASIKKSKKKEYKGYPKSAVRQDIICSIFNQKLSYLCQYMYNNNTIIYKPDYLNEDIGFDDFSDGVIKGFEKLW